MVLEVLEALRILYTQDLLKLQEDLIPL